MKRIIISVLLIILGTSYFVQKEHVLKNLSSSLTERMTSPTATAVVKVSQDSIMPYPAPPEASWPYVPPPDYSHETPLPTPDLSVLPTPAPTMNPLDD